MESTSSGTRYFYVTNYQGFVLQTVDINGTLANTYSYAPYANPTKAGSVADNWTYVGDWQDGGTNLFHLGARYYDPLVGRFAQQDPAQQVNRFPYAADDPVSMADPSGMLFGTFGDWFANETSSFGSWATTHPWQLGVGRGRYPPIRGWCDHRLWRKCRRRRRRCHTELRGCEGVPRAPSPSCHVEVSQVPLPPARPPRFLLAVGPGGAFLASLLILALCSESYPPSHSQLSRASCSLPRWYTPS